MAQASKIRLLDLLLEQKSLHGAAALDRDQLSARIVCSEVFVDGSCIKDPKTMVSRQSKLELRLATKTFVSRGGEKLEAALKAWDFPVANTMWIDAGSSTGGFTDCLLQRGAQLVYAVDVGYNQLHYRLRSDSRVRVLERTRIQDVGRLEPAPERAVADLSFRSIVGVAREILGLTTLGEGIFLIKPQFELSSQQSALNSQKKAEFGGIIRDASLRQLTLDQTLQALEASAVRVQKVIESPLAGRKGNIEYLAWVRLAEVANT